MAGHHRDAGLIGGVSFLLLLIHAVLYYPIQSLYARPVEYLNLDDRAQSSRSSQNGVTLDLLMIGIFLFRGEWCYSNGETLDRNS